MRPIPALAAVFAVACAVLVTAYAVVTTDHEAALAARHADQAREARR